MAALVKAIFISFCHSSEEARQHSYNDVHGWYRACFEHLSGQLWHSGLVRNIWRGGPDELRQSVRVLLHFTQFCIRRQIRHPPYVPWDQVPPHVWTDKSNSAATQDEGEDEADVCVLCRQKRSTITVCGECQEHYCDECIDAHTCGEQVVHQAMHDGHTLMSNSTIWTYATCFVGNVCGPLWSIWGAPLGEGKSGVNAGLFHVKVARRARTRQTLPHAPY